MLLARAGQGDPGALTELFERYRGPLRRVVQIRMNGRLRGRVDASDVVQEVYLEAARRLEEYLEDPSLPFYLWLRYMTGQKLVDAHRRHLGAKARDAFRECSLYRGPMPEASSASMAAELVGTLTTPSQAAVRAELVAQMQQTLNNMEEMDREVLILRHFEQLSNSDVSRLLGLSESAASKRYIRALERLDKLFGDGPGG